MAFVTMALEPEDYLKFDAAFKLLKILEARMDAYDAAKARPVPKKKPVRRLTKVTQRKSHK